MFDVIVIGVGGMGSAALYHLAQRGARVLGLERFDIPNELGSSHGASRIIRFAYWEHPSYVPLVRRAAELWRELETIAGEHLLVTTGSIDAGPPGSPMVAGSLRACRQFSLPHEALTAAAARERFPAYQLPQAHTVVFQPDGGFLIPERCIIAHVDAARAAGARVQAQERVLAWRSLGDHVQVRTDRGRYEGRRLVFTAGAWMPKLARPLAPLTVERQVMLWTTPLHKERVQPSAFPVFYMEVDEGRFYGFPAHGRQGFKIGKYHHRTETVDPDTVNRTADATDEAVLRAAVARYFPDANGPTATMKVCLFTNTRDEHFVVDIIHDSPRVVVAGGFSGHGFKFCSAIGEVIADLCLDGRTAQDVSLFRASRLSG